MFSSSGGQGCFQHKWHLLLSRLMKHLQLIRGQEREKHLHSWLIFPSSGSFTHTSCLRDHPHHISLQPVKVGRVKVSSRHLHV